MKSLSHLLVVASPHGWERTHRFAAPLFVTAGIAFLVYGITRDGSPSAAFVLTMLTVTALAPFLYSGLLWIRLPASDPTGLESRRTNRASGHSIWPAHDPPTAAADWRLTHPAPSVGTLAIVNTNRLAKAWMFSLADASPAKTR